jgi:demethylmenaquinone methyltransferase/2-methoxy-6-polyprenyl-1,4-benzoquinol methylase
LRVAAPGDDDLTFAVVESQKRFYDLWAPDYLSGGPSDRKGRDTGVAQRDLDLRAIVDDLEPTGEVLELGCGPGGFTRELARHARLVTAVDSSRKMLARNQSEVARPNVRYIQADVFEWVPAETYDVVFFGFLLSHVPPVLFEQFWRLVRSCLRPNGRVAFVDEGDRVAHYDDVRVAAGVPIARRRLRDGQEFDIVKIFWAPQELAATLRDIGWHVDVRRMGDSYLYGAGHCDRP